MSEICLKVARAIRLNADVRALQFFVREDGSSRFPDHMFRFAVKWLP